MTVKELREKTNLTQKDFAEKYHFTLRQVQTWEQGYRETPECILYLLNQVIEGERNMSDLTDKKREGFCPTCGSIGNLVEFPPKVIAKMESKYKKVYVEYSEYICPKCGAKWKEENTL